MRPVNGTAVPVASASRTATDGPAVYDYIVVGGGSAGAPLAARLSEDAQTTVLLLEAGPDYRQAEEPHEMRSPNTIGISYLAQFTHFQYPALRARYSAAQSARLYRRGRGLGGSSAINAQIAIRGLPEDFDLWAELGCDGWSWRDVLPDFTRLEDNQDFGDAPYHGRGGPIPIYRTPMADWGAVDTAMRDAALDLGYGWSDDHDAPGSSGGSPYAINSRDGARVSTNTAYLEPARGRPNLTIRGEALVDRVMFGEGRRATGVIARTPAGIEQFNAGQIIVCAGTIHSPAILMRSGIGPADHLRKLGIDVLQHAPVGANLQDHGDVRLKLKLKPAFRAASVDARQTNVCVRYTTGLPGTGRNDMFIGGMNMAGYTETGLQHGLLLVAVWQSFSRGSLRLRSVDPAEDPEVDLALLSDDRDLVRLRDGVQRLWAMAQHPAFARIVEHVETNLAGGRMTGLPPDQVLDQWLQSEAGSTQHASGTCRMGAPGDPRAVVDPDCRVLGISGLRVIDVSIMPELIRANTHITAVMLGEHMARRLRARSNGRQT